MFEVTNHSSNTASLSDCCVFGKSGCQKIQWQPEIVTCHCLSLTKWTYILKNSVNTEKSFVDPGGTTIFVKETFI